MRVAVTGSTGLVGEAICEGFKAKGATVVRLLRPATEYAGGDATIIWDPRTKKIDISKLENFDVIIHLAGANIAGKRWTQKYKAQIRDSRVGPTKFLSECIAQLNNPPQVFISASAIGFYGSTPVSTIFDEDSCAGNDFLAGVCSIWETATKPAQSVGVRTVHARLGVVFSQKGGALAKMLPVFRLGAGGIVGSGTQVMSWIALSEISDIFYHLCEASQVSGSVNVVTPNAVSNMAFTKVLGKVLQQPVFLPLPAFMVKLLLGEMGEALLLGGNRVVPKKLLESGYVFQYADLESALKESLTCPT